MTRGTAAKLIINDRVDIALLSGADGVHLGQSDIPVKDARSCLGPEKIIGATARACYESANSSKSRRTFLTSSTGFCAFKIPEESARPLAPHKRGFLPLSALIPPTATLGMEVSCKIARYVSSEIGTASCLVCV